MRSQRERFRSSRTVAYYGLTRCLLSADEQLEDAATRLVNQALHDPRNRSNSGRYVKRRDIWKQNKYQTMNSHKTGPGRDINVSCSS
jgi:hypothetical protein